MAAVKNHPASDEVIVWLQSLSGMLTKIKTEYGSFPEMVEHPDWDEGRTDIALRLIGALREHLQTIETELAADVKGKFG
jgi:hypothetical protein